MKKAESGAGIRRKEVEEEVVAPKKKEASKKAAESKAKKDKKRKSPGPELEGETEIEDMSEKSAVKKNKSSDEEEVEPPKTKGRVGLKKLTTTKAATKKTAALATPVDIDYDRIIDGVADNVAARINSQMDAAITVASAQVDYENIANHITAAVDTAIKPYLAILEPLMEFTQTCAKLKSRDEENANTNKTAVKSLVEQLEKKGKRPEVSEEKDELIGAKSSAVRKHTEEKSLDPDDLFGDGMSPDSNVGEVGFSVSE